MKLTLFFCLFLTVKASAFGAQWQYADKNEKITKLSSKTYDETDFVSLRSFCEAAGCKHFYSWPQFKAFVKNPQKAERPGVLLSSLSSSYFIDGKVYYANQPPQTDENGFWIPVETVKTIARELSLGSLSSLKEIAPAPETATIPSPGSQQSFKVLVIDPGHGGNDLGTRAEKLFEKDVVLIYAQKLKEELEKNLPGLNVIVTRELDQYVSLQDRAEMANAVKADLFLSLHVNHAPSPKIFGAETYILSTTATDDEAKKTALLENDPLLKDLKSKSQGKKNVIVSMLAEMEQTKYIQQSAVAASFIQQELSQLNSTLGLKNRGVKQAMFFVLSQVAMPSVLVEMGFLSNRDDRNRLMDMKFRDEFVNKLVIALERYKNSFNKKN